MSRYQEIHALEHEEWRERAACIGKPTAWWFPPVGFNFATTKLAKTICRRCEVQEECLNAAMTRDEHGIWGGYNIKERKQMRRELNINRRLICQNCRRIFEKPANKAFATLYCSDRCRKS